LPAASWVKYALLAHFSRPAADRAVYKILHKTPVKTVVELGVGAGRRAERMMEVILRRAAASEVRYTGIDLYEARGKSTPGMSLKEAFRWSKQLGVKTELIPGDPLSALARAANRLTKTDLVIIAADQDREALAQAWFYVPRMLGEKSIVLLEESAGEATRFRTVARAEIDALAAASQSGRRAA
jgi:hypothetical protein